MVLRLLAHNAEHWLSRHLNAYLRDDDEYRAITRQTIIRGLAGVITYTPDALTVTLDQPDAPRVTRALRLLLDEINHTPPDHHPRPRRGHHLHPGRAHRHTRPARRPPRHPSPAAPPRRDQPHPAEHARRHPPHHLPARRPRRSIQQLKHRNCRRSGTLIESGRLVSRAMLR